jgi:hypothetical protein
LLWIPKQEYEDFVTHDAMERDQTIGRRLREPNLATIVRRVTLHRLAAEVAAAAEVKTRVFEGRCRW